MKRLMRYVFYCLFLALISFYLCDALQYHLLAESSTFADAEKACEGINGTSVWTLPLDPQDDKSLSQFMRSKDVSSVWLGMKKQRFKDWKWVTGKTYSSDLFRQYEQPGYNCAGLSLQYQVLHPMNCAEQGSGFVCDISDPRHCPEKYHKQACVQKNGYAYLIVCNSNDWYDARRYCRGLDGDLAILDASEKVNMVLDYLVNQKLTSHCGKLYVGLRKEMWLRSVNTTEAEKEIKDVVWDTGEPVSGRNCARLTVSKYGTRRKTADCSNKNAIVCRADISLASRKTLLPEELEALRSSQTSWKIAGIALIVILLSVCPGAAAVYIVVQKYIRGNKGRKRLKEEVTEERKQPDIPHVPNTKCIVIFSSKSMNSKHHHVTITNFNYVDWSENDSQMEKVPFAGLKGIHFSEKLVEVLIYSCRLMDQAIKNETKTRLHIVNLYSNEYTRKLPSYCLLEILAYLIKQSEAIHAVLLPEFETEMYGTKEVLSKLWELRERAAVITAATSIPSLPADEVIAVGRHTMQLAKPSGNVDFIVNDTVCPDVNEISDGFVAGLAAVLSGSSLEPEDTVSPRSSKIPLGNKTKITRHKLLSKFIQREDRAFEGFGWLEVDSSGIKGKENLAESLSESKRGFETIKIGLIRPCSKQRKKRCLEFRYFGVNFKEGIFSDTQHAFQEEELQTIKETLQLLCDTKEGSTTIFEKKIEVIWFAVLNDLVHLDENLFKKNLKDMQECHIIYFTNLIRSPSSEIQRNITELSKRSVIITQALNARNEFSPCEIPGDRVISIGRTPKDEERYQKYKYQAEENSSADTDPTSEHDELMADLNLETLQKRRGDQSGGSTLDFLCGLDFTKTMENNSEEIGIPGNKVKPATFQVVALVTLILLRAKRADVQDDVLDRLCNTAVMHNILRQICTHPERHDMEEGWGVLQPNKISNDEALRKHIQDNAKPSEYWAGKNL